MAYNSSLKSLVMTYGWGNWRLVHLEGEQFYGAGLGVVDIFDVSLVQFTTTDVGGAPSITALEATSFDTAVPPVFVKSNNPSGAIVG